MAQAGSSRVRERLFCPWLLSAAGSAFCLFLMACSSAVSFSDFALVVPQEEMPPLPRDYRNIVATTLSRPNSPFGDPAKIRPVAISDPRPSYHLKGKSWLICLKVDTLRKP